MISQLHILPLRKYFLASELYLYLPKVRLRMILRNQFSKKK